MVSETHRLQKRLYHLLTPYKIVTRSECYREIMPTWEPRDTTYLAPSDYDTADGIIPEDTYAIFLRDARSPVRARHAVQIMKKICPEYLARCISEYGVRPGDNMWVLDHADSIRGDIICGRIPLRHISKPPCIKPEFRLHKIPDPMTKKAETLYGLVSTWEDVYRGVISGGIHYRDAIQVWNRMMKEGKMTEENYFGCCKYTSPEWRRGEVR